MHVTNQFMSSSSICCVSNQVAMYEGNSLEIQGRFALDSMTPLSSVFYRRERVYGVGLDCAQYSLPHLQHYHSLLLAAVVLLQLPAHGHALKAGE